MKLFFITFIVHKDRTSSIGMVHINKYEAFKSFKKAFTCKITKIEQIRED
jgi:hypothetical protein